MAPKSIAPKKKADFVNALSQLTSISPEVLEKLTVEHLRTIYQTTKPQQTSPLPSNWKRLGKAELQTLYMERVVPWQGNPAPQHEYLRWTKDRLIVELANYVEEVRQEAPETPEIDLPDHPMCPRCKVHMVERLNRQDGRKFYSCLVFPHCRETKSMGTAPELPKASPAKKDGYPKPQNGFGVKSTVADTSEEMDGNARPRAVRAPQKEDQDSSWEAMTPPARK
jgi:ssDNA-binding Zn-finger/Zn-ribbon topoisomerase 1